MEPSGGYDKHYLSLLVMTAIQFEASLFNQSLQSSSEKKKKEKMYLIMKAVLYIVWEINMIEKECK